MRALPAPILSLATQQLSGRGRGANVWLSPAGCLQFSVLLRSPPRLKPSSIVFIQYLFGLAVVEACRLALPGKGGDKVRLKWPNDIYAVVQGPSGEEKKKIGGILVNTNFSGGQVDIVIGACASEYLPSRRPMSVLGLRLWDKRSEPLTNYFVVPVALWGGALNSGKCSGNDHASF
jgi:biotin---protein ligase